MRKILVNTNHIGVEINGSFGLGFCLLDRDRLVINILFIEIYIDLMRYADEHY